MKNHLEKTVSVYANAFDKVGREVNLLQWLTLPDPEQVGRMERIRAMAKKEEQTKAKQSIQCATISGTFKPEHRNDQGLIQHSGLIAIDIDQEANTGIDFSDLRQQLPRIPCCAYVGYSVRGKGLWMIWPVKYPERHKEHFHAIEKDFLTMGIRIDAQCKNISRLRYYSYDPDAYFNPDAIVYTKLTRADHGHPPPVRRAAARLPDDVFGWAVQRMDRTGLTFADGQRHDYLYRFCCILNRAGVPQVEAERWIDINLIPIRNITTNCISYAYSRWRHEFGQLSIQRPIPQPPIPQPIQRPTPQRPIQPDEIYTAMCKANPALSIFVETLGLVNPITGRPYNTVEEEAALPESEPSDTIKVANLYTADYTIYIGRENKKLNLKASKWNNPYSVKEYGRENALRLFREYVTNGSGKHLLNDLHELKGQTLGCYCKPLPCHGDILKELVQCTTKSNLVKIP